MAESTPSGPIADDVKAIAERMKQIQEEEGRREKKPPEDIYLGLVESPYIKGCVSRLNSFCEWSRDSSVVTIGGREFQLAVDGQGTCKLTPIPEPKLPSLPQNTMCPGAYLVHVPVSF